MSNSFPRITFGTIVLNGEPFVLYNLRALYPFAHQIIVVEGAAPAAAAIATPDGHSTDATLATVRRFQNEEDPHGKVLLVTAEDEGYPNGFWPGEKDEQSQVYARRATGDYLWQVDVDEFYREDDMDWIIQELREHPDIAAASFKTLFFWGGFDYVTDGWYLREGADMFHRLFKWAPGYRYATHRPPTVYDENGRDLRSGRWLSPRILAQRKIFLYHYSIVFPKQVDEKVTYYAAAPFGEYSAGVRDWAQRNFLSTISKPFKIHNMHTHPSWLKHFRGRHPRQIGYLRADIESGRLPGVALRPYVDVEALLKSPLYKTGRFMLDKLYSLYARYPRVRWYAEQCAQSTCYDSRRNRLYWEGGKQQHGVSAR